MSVILDDQTLTLNTAVTIPFGTFPPKDVGWVVFTNASPFACRATVGSKAIPIPAWYYYPVEVDGQLTGSVRVTPYLQTIPGAVSTTTLSTTLYDLYEEPNSPIPQPLGGGPIDLTVASSINQTGQPGGNSVVFAEPVGDSSVIGTVNINNLGQVTLGDTLHDGSILIEGPVAHGNIGIAPQTFVELTDGNGNLRSQLALGQLFLNDASAIQRFAFDAAVGSLNIQTAALSFPNGTSGSASLYQFMAGTLKMVVVTLSGWAKTTAGDSVVVLPTAFATCIGIAFGSGPFHLNNGAGVNQTVNNLSTLPTVAGNAGTTVNGTAGSNSNNIFECQTGAIAQFALFGSQTGPFSGMVILIGA